MQLMRGTAARYQVADRFAPAQTSMAATSTCGPLLRRFDGDLTSVIAAYNAGAGNVERFGDVPPFPETQRDVYKVFLALNRMRDIR